MSTTRRELEAKLLANTVLVEQRKQEAMFFKEDLRAEEELFRLLQAEHDDVEARCALEVIQLEDEALKLLMGELVEALKERHRLNEELKKLENPLPQ